MAWRTYCVQHNELRVAVLSVERGQKQELTLCFSLLKT